MLPEEKISLVAAIIFVLVVVLWIGGIFKTNSEAKACEKRGGVYIKTSSGFACIKVEKI